MVQKSDAAMGSNGSKEQRSNGSDSNLNEAVYQASSQNEPFAHNTSMIYGTL